MYFFYRTDIVREANETFVKKIFSICIQSQFPNTAVDNQSTETGDKYHHLHKIEKTKPVLFYLDL